MSEDKQIVDLFEQLADYNPEVKLWVARAIGYAVTADRIVQANETPSLITLFRIIRDIPEIAPILSELLRPKKPPLDTPVEVTADLAEQIFLCILNICAADRNIQSEEFDYINQIGQALRIETATIRQLVNTVIRTQIKATFFRQLLRKLDREGRYWVSVMILKVIQADEQIDQRETHYLNDIHELLQRNSARLEAVKADAHNTPLKDLPAVKFDKDTSLSILKYLLEILMVGKEMDDQEEATIQAIAGLLGFEKTELDTIIETVKSEVDSQTE